MNDPRVDPYDVEACHTCGGRIRGGGSNAACENDDTHDPYADPLR